MDALTNTAVGDEVPQVGEVPQVVPNRADWRKRGHRGRYRMPRTAARRTGQPTAWRSVEIDDKARRARKLLTVAVKRHGAVIDEVYSAVSSGARYAFAEPQTGGEAFVPRRGDQ